MRFEKHGIAGEDLTRGFRDGLVLLQSAPVNSSPTRTQRVLIFVVAYNAERTLASVLDRIPASLRGPNVEVLVIDDSSQDATFATGLARESADGDFKTTVLRTPENQGYGGNQKLGYRYAIDHGFDIVALLHGDGQYAPEKLPDLLAPLLAGEADAVFGSRMMDEGAARRGGMPLYKWIGNRVLSRIQNTVLGTSLSEFHSGYRLYATSALRQIPFQRNSSDFHFDTEIIVQLVRKKLRIRELPIPTYYGDEICHVNGIQYGWNVLRAVVRSRFHDLNLLYDRRFDVGPVEEKYSAKLSFPSSHTLAIAAVQPGARILDIGCGQGYVAAAMGKKAASVTALDKFVPAGSPAANVTFLEWDLDAEDFPVDVTQFDQIFMLDVIEHLRDPEAFLEMIREATGRRRPEIVVTTANIGFFIPRLMLLIGKFNYGRKGILDLTHTRLFTFASLRGCLEESGYRVTQMRGIPAPYALALGENAASRALCRLNEALICLSRGLFSYQVFVRARLQPTVDHLLRETVESSDALKRAPAAAEC